MSPCPLWLPWVIQPAHNPIFHTVIYLYIYYTGIHIFTKGHRQGIQIFILLS